jgi:hypothetical protein
VSDLKSLLDLAGSDLYVHISESSDLLHGWGRCGRELGQLLGQRNGFYAFESSLHVYGIGGVDGREGERTPDLWQWNSDSCWRSSYGRLANGYLFFAEDVFGNQFALSESGETIVSFEAETAEVEEVANSVSGWARAVLDDLDYLTGYPVAHKWQTQFGALQSGRRLLPKLPFLAGGEYAVSNLHSVESVKGMRFRGDIAVQIATLPEGAKIEFRELK